MVSMRLLPEHYIRLKAQLTSDNSVEQGCFALSHHVNLGNDTLLLITDIIPLTPDDFAEQKDDFLSVKPEVMLRIARIAQKAGKAVCMIHTHPYTIGQVRFSRADDIGNERTFDFFNRMLQGKLNSCLVFSGDMHSFEGRVYPIQQAWRPIETLTVVGTPHFRLVDEPISESFDRQARLLGRKGQGILGQLSVGIIGAGGIGSNIAAILAQSGIGKLVLVDHDVIETSNLPRIIGATPRDAQENHHKVNVVARYVNAVTPGFKVETYPCRVQDVGMALATVDVLICATDDAQSRAFLNQHCWQYYIPLMDLGVQFVADETSGELVNEIGKVNWIVPGTTCLWCTGHVSSELLRRETLSPEAAAQEAKAGYIRNMDIPEPSMMAYNMQIAARGAQTLIGNMTGLAPSTPDVMENFYFLGLNGRKHHQLVRKRQEEGCWLCNSQSPYLGAGMM